MGGGECQSSWEVVCPTLGSPWSPRGWDSAVTSCMQTSPLPTCRARRVSPGLDLTGDTQGMLLLVYSGAMWVSLCSRTVDGDTAHGKLCGFGSSWDGRLFHDMLCHAVPFFVMLCHELPCCAVPIPPASQPALSPSCCSTAQSKGARHLPWALDPTNCSSHLGVEPLLPSNTGTLFPPFSRQENWPLW